MNWVPIILSGLGLLGGGAGLLSAFRIPGERRKLNADSAAKLSEAAMDILEPARKQVKDMQAQLDRAAGRISQLEQALEGAKTEVATLKGQLADMTKDLRTAHDEIRRLTAD